MDYREAFDRPAHTRGSIHTPERAKQLVDFSGMLYGRRGTISPMDIDGLIEFEDQCFVFFELKWRTTRVLRGAELALERLVDASRKPAIAIVAEHTVDDWDLPVPAAAAIVRCYYCRGKWWTPASAEALGPFIARYFEAGLEV